MGGSSSKEDKPLYQPPAPKTGDIKVIDQKNLPKLQLATLNVAKPPPIKTGADLRKDKEREALKDLIDFDMTKEFDQETYMGRFMF